MKPTLLFACLLSLLPCSSALASGAIWISNVKLVSPERLDRIESGSVLIENGRITAVERGTQRRKPAGATLVDGKGYFLTPGLIDSHVHLHAVPGMSGEQAAAKSLMTQQYFRQLPRSFLYYGFTTVIDLALADRRVIDNFNQAPLHPQVVHCGEPLVFANGYPMSFAAPAVRFDTFNNFIYDPAQAASIPSKYRPEEHTPAAGVARIKQAGGICVKTHIEHGFGREHNLPMMGPAVFAEVRAAATANGLTLVTHANSFETQTAAVAGDADVLAHGMWHWGALDREAELPAPIKLLLDEIVRKRTGYQPTMQVLYGLRAYFDPAYLNDPGVAKVVPKAMLAWFRSDEGKWFKQELAEEGEDDATAIKGMEAPLRRQAQVVAYLAGKDANITFGTDTPSSPTYGNLPGLNGFLELHRLHAAGMSLAQVFKAATINNARTFKLDAQLGTIEVGKSANLLLMRSSPLQDIAAYDSVVTVWVGGQQVARAQLAAQE
jgi:imidazolonepropionase-like amidohydrolase